MKKIILIITLISLTITNIKAQNKIIWGIKGGMSITNLTSDYFKEYNSRKEFNIGLVSEISIGNRFSIQPEILYAKQGAEVSEIMLGGGPQKTEFNLDYIQIPILTKTYINKNISIELGPSFNFLVKDEQINKTDSAFLTSSDFSESFELSGVIGASYNFKNEIFCSARYIHGLSNVFGNVKNTGFQIGIGYLFK